MPNDAPLPDYTPEEKAKLLAEMKKKVTAEDLLEYAADDGPLIPLDDLIRRAEEQLRQSARPAERSHA